MKKPHSDLVTYFVMIFGASLSESYNFAIFISLHGNCFGAFSAKVVWDIAILCIS